MDIMAIAAVPAGGATFSFSKGFASISNAGTGLNDLVLNNPLDLLNCVILATPRLVTAGKCTVVHTSDTSKRILTWGDDGSGIPALSDEIPFDVLVVRA